MPTSSQALILQTSTGDLPPLFQRRTWQPDQSFRHLPFTAASKTRRANHMTDTRYTSVLFPLRRAGSEPNLARKNDFSTLQNVLQIKRLGALGPSNIYDNKTDFYTMSMRPRELAPIRRNKYVETHVDGGVIRERLFIPEFKKSADEQREYKRDNMIESTKSNKQAFPYVSDVRRKLPKVNMIHDESAPAEFEKVNDVKILPKGQERCDRHRANRTREGAEDGDTFSEFQTHNSEAKLGPLMDQDIQDRHNAQSFYDENTRRPMKLRPKNVEHRSSRLPSNGDRQEVTQNPIYNEMKTEFDRNVAHNGEKPTTFMKSKIQGNFFELEATTEENAEFFRLFETPSRVNENVDGSIFRLDTSTKVEHGSFQISPIENEAVGNFRLIPPDAFDLDDSYRLQTVPNHPNTFTLLQRDVYNHHVFKSVLTDWSISEMTRFYGTSLENPSGKVARLRGQVGNFPLHRAITVPGTGDRMSTELNDRRTENIFGGVNSIKPVETDIESDIRRHQYSNTSAMQHSPHHLDHIRLDTNERLNDPQTDEQREENKKKQAFMGSIRNQSVDMYERLVNLGFRRAVEDPDKDSFYENIRIRAEKDRQKYFSSDWKTHNAHQRTRAMEGLGMSGDTFSSLDGSSFMLNQCKLAQQQMDEETQAIENAAWKKKKIKALRMRKDPPPKDPNAVCICLQDNAIPHSELKRKIEIEVGVKVVSLQFDPVSVHCPDPEVKSQWIIRLPNRIICEYLTKCGLDLDGVHYSVKSFDDVMQKEHNAYRFYAACADMQAKKAANGEKRAKRAKPTHTTGRLPQLKNVAVQ